MPSSESLNHVASTPELRTRVFVSSTLDDLAAERHAAASAVEALRLTPVMLEGDAPAGPPHVDQADVFIGIYWQSYGSVAPETGLSTIEAELNRSAGKPRLIYVKEPAARREPRLTNMLHRIRGEGTVAFRPFSSSQELADLILDDLAVFVTSHARERKETADGETLTFLFADLEGSTGILQRLGDGYPALLSTYHRLVHEAVSGHGGHVVTTEGDGFFCVFAGAVEAVEAALEIQVSMGTRSWPGEERPRCRIGLHTGSAVRTIEGYVGLDIHIAARIGAAAQGGQVLLSSVTASTISDHAGERSWELTDLGHYELRGIGQSERLVRLDTADLPVVTTPPRAKPRTPSVVPVSPKRLIGRVEDLAGASEMLMRDAVRLVTLTGPGGTGKTRLAVELATRLETQFNDGVVFVDLSAVRDPGRLLAVVARSLGVSESPDRSLLDGLEAVIDDSRILLVLDNMEQLLAAAPDVRDLIEKLPKVKLLVTSRAPLRISWENEYPLSPLPVPAATAGLDEIEASDAVVLFQERAKAVRPDFELNPTTEPVVADITRRLDGLPLAIELAAARLRSFSVEMLRDRLDDLYSTLDRGASDAPERHRTLRAAVQWSYDLLDEEEKGIFRRLSVFSGGWVPEAALEVCRSAGHTDARVLDVLEELVAQSLVVFSIDEQGRPRYRMLATLREFALEEMRSAGEEEETRSCHLAWCRRLGEGITDILATPQFPAYLDMLELERFNLREALAWSVESGLGTDDALITCGMLPLFWDTRGYVTEGLRWNRALVAMTTQDGDTFPRAVAHTALGWLEMLAGEPEESDWALDTSVAMFRRLGDEAWLGRALAMQGMTTYNRGRYDDAQAQFDESIGLVRRHGLDWLADAWCTYGLAHIALARNEFIEADLLLKKAYEYSRDFGLTWGVGHTQLSRGVLAFMMGDIDLALQRLRDSLRVRQELRDARGLCDCIAMMALIASVRGEHELAATLLGAAQVAREAAGQEAVPWIQPMLEQAEISATAALGDEYASRCQEGRSMGSERAIELIMSSLVPTEAGSIPVVA